MLSSYPVACPHDNCGWTGNVVPSHLRGGAGAEIVSMHRAWFHCPRCKSDWEVRITDERVTVLRVVEPVGETRNPREAPQPAGRDALESDRTKRWYSPLQ
jgi:hypothetical protein